MPGFFYKLGKAVRPAAQKAKWVWRSVGGSEEESIAAERDAGAEMAAAFEAEAPLADDPIAVALIESIGGHLADCVKNKDRRFTFRIVELAEPNAFALPGGFVYITTALLELCGLDVSFFCEVSIYKDAGGKGAGGEANQKSQGANHKSQTPNHKQISNSKSQEADHKQAPKSKAQASGKSRTPNHRQAPGPDSQVRHPRPDGRDSGEVAPIRNLPDSVRDRIAFILGHEMGHVMRGHAFERMVNQTVVSAAAKAIPVGGVLGKVLMGAGIKAATGAYSQDQEFEADEVGARLAGAAGYDPRGGPRLLAQLKDLTAQHEGPLSEYFASHPPFNDRIAALDRKIK